MHKTRAITIAAAAVSAMILVGCAAIQHKEVMETERLLSAAGFQMKLADTPEKLHNVQIMNQRKIFPHPHNGETRYVYADAKYCECVYVGSEEAYQRYEKLLVQKNIADEQRQAAEMNADAAMNWSVWGPWGPWW